MGKGLQVLVWSALAGLAAFLAMLVKQKNGALELAQARVARLEQRMGQLTSTPTATGNESALRDQLADRTAEVAQLKAQLAALTSADALTPSAITRQAAILTPEPEGEMWRQRLAMETGWHAKAPGLAMVGRAVDALPPAKLAYANRAVQARIVPEVVAQPQDISAGAGVGTIYEQRLYNAGIGTYWELATLDDDALRRILKLDKARALVADLDAMRASARSLAAETETTGYVWNGEPVDDFEPIKGIGKVYEQRLYSAGIRTYAALANTAPERILEIVQARSPIPPDVASWIAEAQALANAETAT